MTAIQMKTATALLLCLAASFVCRLSHAVTIRYALIVGSDIGVDRDGRQPFLPLQHAEREASLLRNALVSLSNFDVSPARTKLLVGATRRDVEDAVQRLKAQKRADTKASGEINTLFFFYFTGHGQRGQLLLKDGPLGASELGAMFQAMGADFSVGIFDACYSGSLNVDALSAKGMSPTPGLNLFRELPEEVLTAEGNIWYVSSGSGQLSYEDATLGGVFTHFFIEGMRMAQPDGPGITLESVWQYARSHTVAYTSERRRVQVPEQYVAKLRLGAPVYFSFPLERTATLSLSEGMSGKYLLTYAGGNLSELFEKKRGGVKRLSVFPGAAVLQRIDAGNIIWKRRLNLKDRAAVILSDIGERPPEPAVGERALGLSSKGAVSAQHIRIVQIEPGLSVLGGVAYGFEAADKRILNARHGFSLPFRFDFPRLALRVSGVYGVDVRHFSAFGYRLHQAGGGIAGEYAIDVRRIRLGVGAACRWMYQRQIYDDGRQRTGFQTYPAASVSALFPRKGPLSGEAFVDLGPLYAPGIGKSAPNVWSVVFTAGFGLYARLI